MHDGENILWSGFSNCDQPVQPGQQIIYGVRADPVTEKIDAVTGKVRDKTKAELAADIAAKPAPESDPIEAVIGVLAHLKTKGIDIGPEGDALVANKTVQDQAKKG